LPFLFSVGHSPAWLIRPTVWVYSLPLCPCTRQGVILEICTVGVCYITRTPGCLQGRGELGPQAGGPPPHSSNAHIYNIPMIVPPSLVPRDSISPGSHQGLIVEQLSHAKSTSLTPPIALISDERTHPSGSGQSLGKSGQRGKSSTPPTAVPASNIQLLLL
jgi:hypothetical protein